MLLNVDDKRIFQNLTYSGVSKFIVLIFGGKGRYKSPRTNNLIKLKTVCGRTSTEPANQLNRISRYL